MFSLVCDKSLQCEFLVYVNKLRDGYVYVRNLNFKHNCSANDTLSKMSINTLVCEVTNAVPFIGPINKVQISCLVCKKCSRKGHSEKSCDM